MKTTLLVESDIMELFQENVQRIWGKLKGAQSEALREAILLWLSRRGEITAVDFHDGRRGRIGTVEEFLSALREVIQRKRGIQCNASVLGCGCEEVFTDALKLMVAVLGNPSSAYISDMDEGEVLEKLEGVDVKAWMRRLFEWEDGVEHSVALFVEWKEAKVLCVIYPSNYFYVGRVHPKLRLQTLLAHRSAQPGRTG
jgi:hypothetical protein